MNYLISCCSTADLNAKHLEEIGVSYIPFNFILNGVSYKDDLWQSMMPSQFYEMMKDNADTKTSQVSIGDFIEYFKSFLDQGLDIIHISLSSGLSGVYNAAMNAKKILKNDYPERNIYIIDSLAASSGYGLLVDKLAALKNNGKTMDEVIEWAENNKLRLNHLFISTDLSYYVKGGRISKTSDVLAGALSIIPILDVDANGKLRPVSKVRGTKKALRTLVDKMSLTCEDNENYNHKCYLSHSDFIDTSEELTQMIEHKFPKLDGNVLINNIGPTIGSHTGPGTIALFYWGESRK